MTDNPKITVALDAQALAHLHFVAASVRDSSQREGLPYYERLRDTCRTIEGALRSHGWRPVGDGTWTTTKRTTT